MVLTVPKVLTVLVLKVLTVLKVLSSLPTTLRKRTQHFWHP